MKTSIRVVFNPFGSFSRGMDAAGRTHTLYGEIAFGPTAVMGKAVRVVLTTEQLRELRDKLTHELQHFNAELEPSSESGAD